MSQAIGIITAFDYKFYEDFKHFVTSLRQHTNIPLYAFPFNDEEDDNPHLVELIKDDYKNISDASYAKIFLPDDLIEQYKNTDQDRWIQWHKADLINYAIQQLSLKKALWIDSDTIVLDDLRSLFDHIHDKFLVTADYFAPLTCKNDDVLYEQFTSAQVSPHQEDIVLNSGVVGFQLPRDQHILNSWADKTKLIAKRPELKQLVTLYDQGTLLWTLRDIKRLDLICDRPDFNHNAKRNAYDTSSLTRWPGDVAGGSLYDEVAVDNPNVSIAHYAGLPKLSHLTKLNHHVSIVHNRHKYKDLKLTKIVGVGLERSGTHSLATMLRLSCRQNSWIRHEYSELGKAAYDKIMHGEYNKLDLNRSIARLDRTDVQFCAEINHRYAPFIEEILNNSQFAANYSFVLQLRNPIDLIRSRIYNCTVWDLHNNDSFISRMPYHYQADLYKTTKHDKLSNSTNNTYRIYDDLNNSIIDMHLWEVTHTLDIILNSLAKLPTDRYVILSLPDSNKWSEQLQKIVPPTAIDWKRLRSLSGIKHGKNQGVSPETEAWVNSLLDDNKHHILNQFNNVLSKYDISPNIQTDLII
ncbi:MAG: hypothetical protein ACXADH_00140 [Candidatus Kariarchaeaceae archaeon]|jgi:hypothetical protein